MRDKEREREREGDRERERERERDRDYMLTEEQKDGESGIMGQTEIDTLTLIKCNNFFLNFTAVVN